MSDKPIIFNDAMVRALIEGRKTQTRRIVKEPIHEWLNNANGNHRVLGGRVFNYSFEQVLGDCPYGLPEDALVPAKLIPGVPKTYCAGVDGRIYSRAKGSWRPLKQWRQPKGYMTVTIVDGSKKRSMSVHRLVCSAFYGEPPTPSHQVRHLDGNPENGKPYNLAWGTQEENWRDRKAHGNGVEGEKHHAARFSDEERRHIRWAVENGLCSRRHAARVLGASQCAIQGICGYESSIAEQDAPSDRIRPITLEITDVRVERLQDIDDPDAKAEGVKNNCGLGTRKVPWGIPGMPELATGFLNPVSAFRALWESINGAGSWDQNPWVWVVTFRPHLINIDQVLSQRAAA